MKSLNFAISTTLLVLLGLVQADFTKGPPFETTSLIHPTRTYTYTGLKSHDSIWHSETINSGPAEHTRAGHPRSEDGTTWPHFDTISHVYPTITHTDTGFQTHWHSDHTSGRPQYTGAGHSRGEDVGSDTFKSPHHTSMMMGVYGKRFIEPSTSGYTPPPACTLEGILCLRDEGNELHPSQTHSWTGSQRTRHTRQTSHHTSDTRSFQHPTHTNVVHTTAHPDKIRSQDDGCKGGCSDGYICNPPGGDFPNICVPDTFLPPTEGRRRSNALEDLYSRSDNAGCGGGCDDGYVCNPPGGDFPNICVPDTFLPPADGARRSTMQKDAQPRSNDDGCGGKCDDGYVCNPPGGDFPNICVPDNFWPPTDEARRSVTQEDAESPSNDGGRPCGGGCPTGQICSNTKGFDYLVCIPDSSQTGNPNPYPTGFPWGTGQCRIEENVDQADGWNHGDLVRNNTRYICMTGSQPEVYTNGTCDCTPRAYGINTYGSHTFPTTFSTAAGYAPSGVTVMTESYSTEYSGIASTSITIFTVAVSTANEDQDGEPTSGAGNTAPFTTPSITTQYKRATAKPAPTDCPLQYVSLTQSTPSRPDCPIYVTIETHSILGNVLNEYASLYEFCKAIMDPVYRADIPWGVDLQPFKAKLCVGNGIYKRDVAAYSAPAETINSAHPTPTSDTTPIYIQLYAGKADIGGTAQPQYITVYDHEGLSNFCERGLHATELPQGVNLDQVLAQYCKGVSKPSITAKPTKSKRSDSAAQTIDAAHPKPSNDYVPIWIELGPSDGATGYIEVYMESLAVFCDLVGVQQDGVQTLSYISNPDQVSKEFCQG